jgi:hypothetical protein
MPTIGDNQSLLSEVVLTERVTTTEFRIVEIHESIQNRNVHVDVELGPFITETMPNGETIVRGSSRRGVRVWNNESYDAVRDTWRNEDLIAAVTAALNS